MAMVEVTKDLQRQLVAVKGDDSWSSVAEEAGLSMESVVRTARGKTKKLRASTYRAIIQVIKRRSGGNVRVKKPGHKAPKAEQQGLIEIRVVVPLRLAGQLLVEASTRNVPPGQVVCTLLEESLR